MKFFRPEFLNRFDDLIFFTPLRMEELVQIVDIMLRETREMLGEKNMQLKLSDTARQFLAEKGYDPAFGARPLRRAIQEYLEDPLSDLLIQGTFVPGDIIFTDAGGGKLEFKKDVGGGKAEDPFAELDKKEEAEGEPGEQAEGENVDENGVEDPFAELDGEGEQTQQGQQPGAQAQPDQQAQQPGAQADAQAGSPFPNPDGTPPQPGQEGYVFPANGDEANQQPVDENGNPIGAVPEQANDEQQKRSFLNKMFVRPPSNEQNAQAGARDSRGGGGDGGIRFVDGKIVEEWASVQPCEVKQLIPLPAR
jgi:ATPases with chaperone activity, ATP-binding subunit